MGRFKAVGLITTTMNHKSAHRTRFRTNW